MVKYYDNDNNAICSLSNNNYQYQYLISALNSVTLASSFMEYSKNMFYTITCKMMSERALNLQMEYLKCIVEKKLTFFARVSH